MVSAGCLTHQKVNGRVESAGTTEAPFLQSLNGKRVSQLGELRWVVC